MLKDKIGKNCLLWKTHPLTNTHAGGTRSLYGLFIDLPVAIDKVESWTRAVWVVVVLVFAQCLDDSGSRPVGRRGAKGMRDEGTSLLQLQDNQLLSLPAEHAWYGRFVPSSSLLSSSSSFLLEQPSESWARLIAKLRNMFGSARGYLLILRDISARVPVVSSILVTDIGTGHSLRSSSFHWEGKHWLCFREWDLQFQCCCCNPFGLCDVTGLHSYGIDMYAAEIRIVLLIFFETIICLGVRAGGMPH